MQYESCSKRQLAALINSYGSVNVIESSTQISQEFATLIDLLITNIPLQTTMSGAIACDISDHLAIFIRLRKCSVKRLNSKVLVRSFQNAFQII